MSMRYKAEVKKRGYFDKKKFRSIRHNKIVCKGYESKIKMKRKPEK